MTIDRILPLTEARDNFSRIVAEVVDLPDGMYILTKGGKPAVALVNIDHLQRMIDTQANRTDLSFTTAKALVEPHKQPPAPPKSTLPKVPPTPVNVSAPVVPLGPPATPAVSPPSPPPVPAIPFKPTINPTWTGAVAENRAVGKPVPVPALATGGNQPNPKPPVGPPTSPWPIVEPAIKQTSTPPPPAMSAPTPTAPTTNPNPNGIPDTPMPLKPLNQPPPAGPFGAPQTIRSAAVPLPESPKPIPPPPPNPTVAPFAPANISLPSPSTAATSSSQPSPAPQPPMASIEFDSPPKTAPNQGLDSGDSANKNNAGEPAITSQPAPANPKPPVGDLEI